MSNDSAKGFVVIAMRNLGYEKEDIEKVIDELHYTFDTVTNEQAEKEYYNPFKYDKEEDK